MARKMKDSGIEWIGEIPEAWHTSKLKYLGQYINGYAFKPEEWGDTGLPIVRIQDLTGSNDKPNFFDGAIPEKYLVNDGDILVSWAATLDAFIWKKGKGWLNQHIFKAIPRKEVIDYYFFFWMIKEAMKNMNNDNKHGIFMQHVTLDVFNNFTIPMPPLSEQQRIAAYLEQKCSEIDTIIANTRSSIEEYKKLKQAVITQAVTKGVRGERSMKDSGCDWLGEIPEEWTVYRIANLFDERSENGSEELPILTVSINTGVSDHEIADEDKDRVFIRIEDRSKYKRVYPGDLTYNMMRAWQGAFGAVRVDGMVSPAYVVAKPKDNVELDNRYMEALLRTSEATEEMHRYSRGIVDFRLRLYWPEFKNIRICLPPIEEQKEIADYIDIKSAEIDKLIAKKESFIAELEQYKKSMIYEYVTGKKEVPTQVETITTLDPILLKALLYMRVQELLASNCRGRIQVQKMLYMVENMNDVRLGSRFYRQKYGPLDEDLDKIEAYMEQRQWLKAVHGKATTYQKLENYEAYRSEFAKHWGQYDAEITRLVDFFAPMKTSQAERFATLMAVWNDFILEGKATPTDDELIDEAISNWHPRKANYQKETWLDTLVKMRLNGIVPHGYGKHTEKPIGGNVE